MVDARLQKEVNEILTDAALKGDKFGEDQPTTHAVDPGIKALETDFTPKVETSSQQPDSSAESESASERAEESEGQAQDDAYYYGMGQ